MKLSSPIYTLKRRAKLLARDSGIKLHSALNQLAKEEGFKDWSHLASSYANVTPAKDILNDLKPGELVLIGARPGHGKTLLGLELAALAGSIHRQGIVFSLDYTEQDVRDRYAKLGYDPYAMGPPILIDTSDDICADYVMDCIDKAPDEALVVVDYLQLLDQRRSTPPLAEQVRALKVFAEQSGAIVVLISQIDRAFEQSPNTMPSLEDVRLPNPVDLSLFDKRCFLHDGDLRIERAA